MTTPLPSRLRASAQAMRNLQPAGVVAGFFIVQSGKLVDNTSADRIARELEEAAQALEASQWMPIETAPRGSGEDGPHNVNDPGYVEPPKLLLWTAEGPVVGYYDWYYHPGYGRGAEPGESTWRNQEGGRTYDATHWMPLPTPPSAKVAQEGGGVASTTAELLESLEDMARQHCHTSAKGETDSGALSTNAQVLRLLAEAGRFRIDREAGRMVIGYWPENDPERTPGVEGTKNG